MREGRYQIGLDPKPFLLCHAKAEGADLFIVGGWLNSPAYAFIAAKGRGIRTLADLKGKKVSVREPDGIDARSARAAQGSFACAHPRLPIHEPAVSRD